MIHKIEAIKIAYRMLKAGKSFSETHEHITRIYGNATKILEVAIDDYRKSFA